MPMSSPCSANRPRPLRLYHLYRLLIGLAGSADFQRSLENQLLNVTHSRLFILGSWGYLIINTLIILVMPRAERLAPCLPWRYSMSCC